MRTGTKLRALHFFLFLFGGLCVYVLDGFVYRLLPLAELCLRMCMFILVRPVAMGD